MVTGRGRNSRQDAHEHIVRVAFGWAFFLTPNQVVWLDNKEGSERMANESMTATRVKMVGIRSRDLLWMFTVCTIVNIAMLYLISSGATSVYLPMTVMIVLVNILTILGMIDAMDDLKAASEDFDEQDQKSNIGRRFEETQWGMFKMMVTLIFGGTGLSLLYVMYL